MFMVQFDFDKFTRLFYDRREDAERAVGDLAPWHYAIVEVLE